MRIFDVLKKKTKLLEKPIDKCITPEINSVQQRMVTSPLGNVTSDRVSLDASTFDSLKSRFIAFDVETTGLNAISDRIVEIGAVLFEKGIPTSSFGTLVNPGREIPPTASKVNHITNAMLKTAPGEEDVYQDFIKFLEDAAYGKVIMCAHNAKFDFDFISNTLCRLGINAQFKYVDTLSLARRYIPGLDNYKQCTISASMGLNNDSVHRAESDAKICGEILYNILNQAEKEVEKEKKKIEDSTPTQEELEVCAYIQKRLSDRGADTSWLRFRKNSNNYVDITCLYACIKFKYTKKGIYIIVLENATEGIKLPIESCTTSEGGMDYRRVYFSSPYDLEPIMDYLLQCYNDSYQSMCKYISYSNRTRHKAEESIRTLKALSYNDIIDLLAVASTKEYNEVNVDVKVDSTITRSNVVIDAVHNRCPLENIKNLDDFDKGFTAGFAYWEQGELVRKQGKIDEAIHLFDKARYNGYDAPTLYESYAIVYRQLKDYENEIDIIDEFLARNTYGKEGVFITRRDKAINLLFKNQQNDLAVAEKATATDQKKLEKQKADSNPKQSKGRTIIQLTDDGTLIKEYKTVTAAASDIGISTKCIRDAAQGVQKHAGGYCWKYKD